MNVGHLYKYQSGDCSGGAVKSSHISCSSSVVVVVVPKHKLRFPGHQISWVSE